MKNDYEIAFSNETSVVPCEDAEHLPSVQFDFVAIGDLESASKDSLVGESHRAGPRARRAGPVAMSATTGGHSHSRVGRLGCCGEAAQLLLAS